jgi:DNA ligase D-like protein (predicted 3'-phosphoesterase)
VPRFVVQLHHARAVHYDVRFELGGVLRSWAVPKGPSLDPGEKRLAVAVPDHDLGHADYEGPAVIVWDEGAFELVREREGHLVVALEGHKLHGGFALTHTGAKNWILVKMDDAAARRGSDIVSERPGSVRTGRTLG